MEDGELFKRYRETGDIADRNRIVEKYQIGRAHV